MPARNAGGVFDRRDDLDEAVFQGDLDAEAREATLGLLLQFFVIGLVEVGRVRVEARHHALDGGGEQLGIVDRFNVLMLDLPENFREEPQLVERQGCGGGRCLCGGGKLQGGKNAGSQACGNQADIFQVLTHRVGGGRKRVAASLGRGRTSITAHLYGQYMGPAGFGAAMMRSAGNAR